MKFLKLLFLFILSLAGAFGNAKVDLSDADGKMARLGGEWRFYPNEFVVAGSADRASGMSVVLPEPWNDHYEHFGGGYFSLSSGMGYGTYITTVNLPESWECKNVIIETRRIKMNYRIYVNDVQIGSLGEVGSSQGEVTNRYYPKFWMLPDNLDCREFDISIQVSNFHYTKGGIDGPLLIGEYQAINSRSDMLISIRALSGGIIIMASLVSLVFYLVGRRSESLRRKKITERSLLNKAYFFLKQSLFDYSTYEDSTSIRKYNRANGYFAVFAGVLGLRLFFESEKIINIFFPNLGPEITLRADLICLYIGVPMLLFYQNHVLPGTIKPLYLKLSAWMMIVFFPLSLVSLYIAGKLLSITFICMLVMFSYMAVKSAIAVYYKKSNSLLFFISVVLLLFGTVNDISYDLGIFQTFFVYSLTVSVFCALHLVLLSRDIFDSYLFLEEKIVEEADRYRELYSGFSEQLDKERISISNDMHDAVNSSVFVLKNRLEEINPSDFSKGEFDEIKELADKTYNTFRRFVTFLHPEVIDKVGLVSAIESFCKQIESENRIIVFNASEPIDESWLETKCKNNMYLCVREAMTNSIKHSKAETILIRIKGNSKRIQITIEDDGIGFDASNDKIYGHGIHSMKVRMKGINGRLEIDSDVHEGCAIIIHKDRTL